ncbi:MAG: hypothetical protein GSR85_10030 [Desulfurococcales archaeon]|nr:hypothetical protein [Desulfurococcales archaeon]
MPRRFEGLRFYTGGKDVYFDPYTRRFAIIFDSTVVFVDFEELVKATMERNYVLELRRV